MVAGKSPECLPPGFTEKVKYRNGRKIKYYYNVATGAKYHSKKDVISCTTADNVLLGTPQTTNGDDNTLSSENKVDAAESGLLSTHQITNGDDSRPSSDNKVDAADSGLLSTPQITNRDDNRPSSDNKVDAILAKTNDSPEWLLPNGWTMEERTRKSGTSKGSIYKVYTDLSSGNKFYSRAAVTRYLNTIDHANTMSVQNKVDNVDETFPNMSLESNSITNTVSTSEKKNKGKSFKMVTSESMAADDLPPGWIKEIKITKSGKKIRKDPYYTDPVSGYVFRSKPDALRYLKTNDISSCACKPFKRELDDRKLVENEIPSSNPAVEKLLEHKSDLLGGELNDGREGSSTKNLAESDAKISKQTQENEVSEADPEAIAVDAAISSPITDPSTKQQLSGSALEKRTEKSKKRGNLSLPSRASKRLAGCEPNMLSNTVLDERSLRAASRESSGIEVDASSNLSPNTSASIHLSSDIEPSKEPDEQVFKTEETFQEIEPLKKVEKPDSVIPEEQTEPLNKVEKPPLEEPVIPEEQTVGTEEQTVGTANEMQIDESKRSEEASQLCFDFGDSSWSDPLEFALKTLRGEIPIENTLQFPGCFTEPVNIPYNNQENGCSRPSQFGGPTVFQNEVVPGPESSRQNGAVDQLPTNSSSSSSFLGNISFPTYSGFNFNCQSGTDAGKKDSQTKFNP